MDLLRVDFHALRSLVLALNDAKRIRSADLPTLSLAQRGFARSWRDLCAGDAVQTVAFCEAAAAVAAVELGALDAAALRRGGLDDRAITDLFQKAVAKAGASLKSATQDRLFSALPRLIGSDPKGQEPAFVGRLQRQPRAGATHPSAGRLVLEPAESHADHCQVVAVAAVLFASESDLDVAPCFLAGIAHHLHNASLPDGGFAAENLIGDRWPSMVELAREEALSELPATLAASARDACEWIAGANDPGSRAFHAADVIDRVAEAAHFEHVARFRLAEALGPFGLVHPGPLKSFQDEVLAELGLGS